MRKTSAHLIFYWGGGGVKVGVHSQARGIQHDSRKLIEDILCVSFTGNMQGLCIAHAKSGLCSECL